MVMDDLGRFPPEIPPADVVCGVNVRTSTGGTDADRFTAGTDTMTAVTTTGVPTEVVRATAAGVTVRSANAITTTVGTAAALAAGAGITVA